MRTATLLSWCLGSWTCEAVIFPVTGLRTGFDRLTATFPSRQNIRDLQISGAQWDLFILGLSSLQKVPEEDQFSYFQLSGIHGRPFIPWNGVNQVKGAPLDGYCTHGEVLFGIWHRPLVALFEQVLAQHLQTIASLYSGPLAETYKTAADRWRMPYRDWADGQTPSMPSIFSEPNVTVVGPDGQVTLDNPLFTYRFQQFPLNDTLFPTDCDTDYDLYSYRETLRCPDPATNQSNDGMADSNVEALKLAKQVYTIYTRLTDFESISTTACNGASIENIHNEVHVAVGNLHPIGHFAHLGYSGFDPIFMLHHAAIDRHVALWQAIYYNASIFNSSYLSPVGQFATAPGTNISADSPLKPFYADRNGTFHTSNSLRDIATLGYTYPELIGRFASSAALAKNVRTKVNGMYGKQANSSTTMRLRGLNGRSEIEYIVKLAGRVVFLGPTARVAAHGEVSLTNQLVPELNMTSVDSTTLGSLRNTMSWDVIGASGEILAIPQHAANVSLFTQEVTKPERVSEFPRYGKPRALWDVPRRNERNRRTCG